MPYVSRYDKREVGTVLSKEEIGRRYGEHQVRLVITVCQGCEKGYGGSLDYYKYAETSAECICGQLLSMVAKDGNWRLPFLEHVVGSWYDD